MKIVKYIFSAFFLLLVSFLIPVSALAQGPVADVPKRDIVPGEIVVKFKPHVGRLGAQGSIQAAGLQAAEISSQSGAFRIKVAPGREAETIAQLMARGDVEYATPNYYIQAFGDPNDTYYWLQWALKQTQDHDIDAPEAWDIYTGSGNITIAIIDSGVDLDHPDLQANIVPGYDFVNDDNNPDDDHYHGTHVAGIAAAVGNNSQGVAGVSWGAKIMPLKVLNSAGSGNTADLTDAIYYAVNNGAKVINMSLGAPGSSWPCNWPNVEAALNYAVANNVLVVVASGNDYQNGVSCPGAYDQVMAVGSTTSSDTRSSFSNYGPRLDIVAPGSSIYSTFVGGGYGYLSGTSMATPQVAGFAALIWSYDPSRSLAEIRDIIQNTADDLVPPGGEACSTNYPGYVGGTGWDPCFGYGRINAYNALAAMTNLQTSVQPSLFLIDDASSPLSGSLQISTASSQAITWTTTISPNVSWLTATPPDSGSLSASSSPVAVNLTATQPAAYGTYVTNVIVTGTSQSGATIGPETTPVQITYVAELKKFYFPLIFKN